MSGMLADFSPGAREMVRQTTPRSLLQINGREHVEMMKLKDVLPRLLRTIKRKYSQFCLIRTFANWNKLFRSLENLSKNLYNSNLCNSNFCNWNIFYDLPESSN